MAKAKVSVTIEERLLRRALDLGRGKTRSAVIEGALAQWVRSRRKQRLDDEVERYYAELSAAERDEDERWARMGDEAFRESR